MKKFHTYLIAAACMFFIGSGPLLAATRKVPDDFTTIQAAIDASAYGDTVLVSSGYYREHLTLKNGVKVFGEDRESTYLSGTHSGSVVTANGVTNAELSGFWIYYAGDASPDAGVKIIGGDVVISNNQISHNKSRGVLIYGESSAIIRNNIIRNNGDTETACVDYGLIILHSTPLITNNFIYNNKDVGIYVGWEDSEGTRIINNTIVNNPSDGIWCCSSAPIIKNNIIVSNGHGIAASHGGLPDISYNDVWNNSDDYNSRVGGVANPGPGDISTDPLFDTDYYLSEESPCIDAGDPNPIYNDIDGNRNDMGAYGGQDGYPYHYGDSPITSGFLFTSIGKIPVSEITQTGSFSKRGLANVSTEVANDLHIYKYTDAPFGGKLWINGLFGFDDSTVRYYQILVAKRTGKMPPSLSSFTPLLDPLTKIKYTINADGSVLSKRITLGPKTISGEDGLHERTNVGYWAHRDLKIIWDTTWMDNGIYDITYKAYSYSGFPFSTLSEVILPANDQDRITVRINNSPVQAQIHMVKYDSDEEIPACGIIHLGSNTENVKFVITARHPEGYLRNYALTSLYGKNQNSGDIARDQFVGSHDTTPYWYGVNEVEFNSADALALGQLVDPWQDCAYQFRLRAWARTTDGYHHIRGAEFNDHYYLQIE